jgi:2,4-dienoyl-CoA reductase-like NADH-dependent reductase (Old Yellow Enzyme family)
MTEPCLHNVLSAPATGRSMHDARTATGRTALSEPLALRSGVILPNRLAKAATSEHLADRRGAPTHQLVAAYQTLARSGAGLLISGNVMVDGAALEAPRNFVIEDSRHCTQLRRWVAVTTGTDTKFILQLSHPGRQTMRGSVLPGRRHDVVGPSEVPLAMSGSRFFRAPRALSDAEITAIIGRFARAARVAADAGFHGVEVQAAHGYLFNQFLSPPVNRRADRWGGSPENRMRLLVETVQQIRAATSDRVLIAVKLNSADFQRGGFDTDDSLRVALALQDEGIDLMEISGGTYESAAMVTGTLRRGSTRAREAYFLEFAKRFTHKMSIPVMLTGGFRTRQGMIDAVESGSGRRRRTGTAHHLGAGPAEASLGRHRRDEHGNAEDDRPQDRRRSAQQCLAPTADCPHGPGQTRSSPPWARDRTRNCPPDHHPGPPAAPIGAPLRQRQIRSPPSAVISTRWATMHSAASDRSRRHRGCELGGPPGNQGRQPGFPR